MNNPFKYPKWRVVINCRSARNPYEAQIKKSMLRRYGTTGHYDNQEDAEKAIRLQVRNFFSKKASENALKRKGRVVKRVNNEMAKAIFLSEEIGGDDIYEFHRAPRRLRHLVQSEDDMYAKFHDLSGHLT